MLLKIEEYRMFATTNVAIAMCTCTYSLSEMQCPTYYISYGK